MLEPKVQKKGFFRRHWLVFSILMISILSMLGMYVANRLEIHQNSKSFELKQRELVDKYVAILSESSKNHHVDMARTMSWVVRNLLSDNEVLSSYFAQINTDGDLKEISYFDSNGNLQYSTTKNKIDQRIRPSVLNKLKNADELTVIDESDSHIIGVPIFIDGKRSGVLVVFGTPSGLNLANNIYHELPK